VADLVRVLFFPSLLAGVACCMIWRRLPDRDNRLVLLLVGIGLFTIPQFFVVIVGTVATELLLYRQVVLGIWLSLFGLFAAWKTIRNLEGRPIEGRVAYTSARSRRANHPVILGLLALVFGGFGVYMLGLSAEDLVLPRVVYRGPITRKWIQHGTRSAPEYYLRVNGRSVQVGEDLFTRVRPGETVRVEVTAGSHTVVNAYRVVAPSY
jgi:hypothetical protein